MMFKPGDHVRFTQDHVTCTFPGGQSNGASAGYVTTVIEDHGEAVLARVPSFLGFTVRQLVPVSVLELAAPVEIVIAWITAYVEANDALDMLAEDLPVAGLVDMTKDMEWEDGWLSLTTVDGVRLECEPSTGHAMWRPDDFREKD